MEASNSHSKSDMFERSKILYERYKTDSDTKMTDKPNGTCNGRQVIDTLEREEFEEENRLLKECSNLMVDRQLEMQAHYSGNLSSANSSLASSSETISTLSNITSYDHSLPGCSKSDDCEGSNVIIKNMIHSRTPIFSIVEEPCPPAKEDFMQKLLNSNTQEKKDFPRGKLYKGDLMEQSGDTEACDDAISGPSGRTSSNASSIASTSSDNREFSVPSTSNADRLLGLDESGKRTSPKATSYQYDDDDDESDDEVNNTWCTCLSSHEDDDDEDQDLEDRQWCRNDSRTKHVDKSYGGISYRGSKIKEKWNDATGKVKSIFSPNDVAEKDYLIRSGNKLSVVKREKQKILYFGRKRRYEPPPPQSGKKFCSEGSVAPSTSNDWSNAHLNIANSHGPPELRQWLKRFQTWSNGEKTNAIDALINCCQATHVRHMMKIIEPLLQRDFISLLPKELALTVLGYLQPKDLLRAAQTCRYWRFLADDNLLWKEQCRRIGLTKLKKKMPRTLPRCASPWKAAYMRQSLIEENWLHKPVANPMVMRGHDDHVITCLQFYGNRILSGSDDTTLKVWSAVTGKCLRTLEGHSGGVWSSQMVGDLVISGSTDRALRVWNAKTGMCLKVLTGHTSTVRCMHLHENKVVSGSRDATLRVWSIPDGRCLKVLVGHLAAVRCVQYDGKLVVSGAYDFFVKVWNPDTGECLHTLAGHTNRVYSLQFDGIHVVSGSLDTSIRVWDVESGQLKHTLTGHQSLTSGMELHSNILVSGNADSTVKVWDITTGHCLHTLSGAYKHQSAVTCLQSSNRFVITSSDDGTVKLWDVRTGAFIRNLVELGSGGSGGVVWRIRASATKLICAVGSRNGTEETKLLVLDFDIPGACRRCNE